MKKIVEFEVEGGPPVYVEVEAPATSPSIHHRLPRGGDDRHDAIERDDGSGWEPKPDDPLPIPPFRRGLAGEVRDPSVPYATESRSGGRWRGALEQVRPAVEDMIDVFKSVATPDEVGIEFSLKLNTKVNAFVFSSDGEATFKVSLKWSNPKAGEATGNAAGRGGGA